VPRHESANALNLVFDSKSDMSYKVACVALLNKPSKHPSKQAHT